MGLRGVSEFWSQAFVYLSVCYADCALHVSWHIFVFGEIGAQHYDVVLVRSLWLKVVKSLLVELSELSWGKSGVERISDV